MTKNLKGTSDCGKFRVRATPCTTSRSEGTHYVYTLNAKTKKLVHWDMYYANDGVFSFALFLADVPARLEKTFPQSFGLV